MVSLIHVVVLFATFNVASFAAKPGSITAPLPRSKGSKGGLLTRGNLGQGFFGRFIRDIKGNFCSEMESLALQLTRPIDSTLSVSQLEDLLNCLNAEYENPIFLVSLLSKLSRKLSEPNIYTKLKCLVVLHKLTDLADTPARHAIMKCVSSLQKETDMKTGDNFFSMESITELEKMANNVAELETVELGKLYAEYVFDYISLRGDKTPPTVRSAEKADLCLRLLESGGVLQERCAGKTLESSKISLECANCVKADKTWVTKLLTKLAEFDLGDESLENEVDETLKRLGKTPVRTRARGDVKVEEEEEEEEEPLAKQSTVTPVVPPSTPSPVKTTANTSSVSSSVASVPTTAAAVSAPAPVTPTPPSTPVATAAAAVSATKPVTTAPVLPSVPSFARPVVKKAVPAPPIAPKTVPGKAAAKGKGSPKTSPSAKTLPKKKTNNKNNK